MATNRLIVKTIGIEWYKFVYQQDYNIINRLCF